MIEPFSERVAGPSIISYGLQSAVYDVRLDPKIEIIDWARAAGVPLDPLAPTSDLYFERSADPYFVIPPHGFVVGRTIEYLRVPRNIQVNGKAKNTYSKKGLSFEVANINPGWEGHLTLHISNNTPASVKLYGGMGIIALEFHGIDGRVERDYKELEGARF